MGRGLGWVTHRGPCQPPPCCDSVIPPAHPRPAGSGRGKKPSSTTPQPGAGDWRRLSATTGTLPTRLRAPGWTSSGSFPEALLSVDTRARRSLSEKAFGRSPEEERGSFERWDLRRGSDSRAESATGRERHPMGSWGASRGVWPAGRGRFSFPSTLPW